MNCRTSKGERGIAMLIVLFALLLLTVIGLGMMYSTNMETAINSNYRDKQVAFYAALAGLQEARDRIQPATANIVAPTTLPSTSFANVIYIVSNAATVKPWDTSNEYFDTELCQEKVMSLSGTAGVPCTSIASGTSWYSVVDDSLSSSAPWNLTSPLDLKWVRISLKGNNNTPVPVNGDTTSSAQACWDGANQMSTPTGYTTGCLPTGGVTTITVITSGSGYTSIPSVDFSGGGGGTGAVATAVMAAEMTGYVASITLTSAGSGYTSAPTVTFSSGSAAATAVLSSTGTTVTTDGTVTGVTVTNGGSGYTSAPTVSFGGPGSGATATVILSSSGTVTTTGYVSTVNVSAGGTLYTSAPTVGFSGGGGSGASATAVLATAGSVKSVSLDTVGTQCYSTATDAVITFSSGGGSGAAASAVLETTKSCIFSATVTASPQCNDKIQTPEYATQDVAPNLTLDVGNYSASATLTVSSANDKSPSSMSIQNPGYDSTNYVGSTITTARLRAAGGASWSDCGNIYPTFAPGYRIASITVTNGGSGYTSTPTVSVSGGVGSTSNPTATATRGFAVSSVTVNGGGTGYTSAPSVSFSGGDGTGASGTASIVTSSTTTYPVASVTVNSGGTGYTSVPTVSFSGGSGSGAAGTATIAPATVTTYPIESITVDVAGTGYSTSSPPTVTISGGGGSGAAATANISLMATGFNSVQSITVNTSGSGYTTNPTVTLTGGGGSGATAIADISGGTKFGKVWLLTSLAQTSTGARSMVQMEVASPVLGYSPGGALTLDGPNPIIDAMPNSMGFMVKGNDQRSCGGTAEADHPAIDGYDDPEASPPTNSVTTIVSSLPRPENYTGTGDTPSVQNGYGSLGESMTTPTGLQSMLGAIYNTTGSAHYTTATAGSFNPATTTRNSITYVDGDLTLGGNPVGYGILVVTGTLNMSGNFTWYGLVFVVGDGIADMSGGGNAQVVGSMLISKIWDSYMTKNLLSTIGSPTFNWNGGGGNGIQYDSCYATDLMNAVPWDPPPTTKPLKILSTRILPY